MIVGFVGLFARAEPPIVRTELPEDLAFTAEGRRWVDGGSSGHEVWDPVTRDHVAPDRGDLWVTGGRAVLGTGDRWVVLDALGDSTNVRARLPSPGRIVEVAGSAHGWVVGALEFGSGSSILTCDRSGGLRDRQDAPKGELLAVALDARGRVWMTGGTWRQPVLRILVGSVQKTCRGRVEGVAEGQTGHGDLQVGRGWR